MIDLLTEILSSKAPAPQDQSAKPQVRRQTDRQKDKQTDRQTER